MVECFWLGLQFLADRANMHINGAAIAKIGIAPDLIEQSLAREDSIGSRGQGHQQVKLLNGQRDRFTHNGDAARRNIDNEIAKAQLIAARLLLLLLDLFRLCLSSWLKGCRTSAQDSLDAANQLAWTERFDKIVIRTRFQTRDTIVLALASGQHQNR